MEFLDKLWFSISKFYRKWRKTSWVLCAILVLFILFNKPILSGIGNFLMKESPLEKADAIFILGGNIYDRPMAAKQLMEDGWSDKIIPLGANYGIDQMAWNGGNEDKCIPDALLMQEFLLQVNVPSESIIPIPKGTSTKEESDEILQFSLDNNYKTIIVVSDYFHLRRINYVFMDKFAEKGIKVILRGAKSSTYKEETWWGNEQALIMVNNEYVKLVYYWLKGY